MKTMMTLLYALLLGASVATFSGCEDEGPAEEFGESVDEAAEEVEDEIDDNT